MPQHHLNNPILASLDIAGVGVLLGYWTGVFEHWIAILATGLTGLWYAYCLYEALEKRFKSKQG